MVAKMTNFKHALLLTPHSSLLKGFAQCSVSCSVSLAPHAKSIGSTLLQSPSRNHDVFKIRGVRHCYAILYYHLDMGVVDQSLVFWDLAVEVAKRNGVDEVFARAAQCRIAILGGDEG